MGMSKKQQAEISNLKRLLKLAKCPVSVCHNGAIPYQVDDDEWEAEQCQFCYEKDLALKEVM